MSFLEIKWFLPTILVSVGLIVLLVAWVFYRRGQQALIMIDQIYALNRSVDQDLLNFLAGLSDTLSPLADFNGLTYAVDWYGQPVEAQAGRKRGYPQLIELDSEDVSLQLTLYWRRKRPGERWIFHEVLVRTLTALMKMNLLLKQETQMQAQQQAARSMLFLSHDIKNLAQFIQLQGDVLKRLEKGSADKNLSRLVRSSGLAQQQANDILLKLRMPEPAGELMPIQRIELVEFCCQKAEAFGLQLEVSGDAVVDLPESVMDAVLENIYGNALEHGQVSGLYLEIEQEQSLTLRFIQQRPIDDELLQRVFEPLASQTGEKGRGIGMYQCRELLARYGARVEAFNTGTGQAVIAIHLPPSTVTRCHLEPGALTS